MGILDILKSIGQGAQTVGTDVLAGLKSAAPVAGDMLAQGGMALGNAMQAQGNPLAFQAAQQQKMEQMREDFQSKQGGILSAFQQAQLGMMRQERDDRNRQWLMQMQQQGAVEPTVAGDPNGEEISGQWFKASKTPMITPPPELQNVLGSSPIPMTKVDPGIASILGDWMKGQYGKKQASLDLPGVLKQVDSLFPIDPNNPDDDNSVLNARYKNMFQSFAASGDKTRMDTLLANLTDADRKEKLAAKQAGDIQTQQDKAGMAAARIDLPDANLRYWYKQIKEGRMSETDATRAMGISDKYGRRRWNEFLAQNGDPLPVALSARGQHDLMTTDTVNDSLKKLKTLLEPYKNDSRPAMDLIPRLKYALGVGDNDNTGLISLGEMDRLRGVAQSLTGLRTGFTIIEQGMIHTPNFWKDSGKNMYDKVKNMADYLDKQEDNIYKFESKTGVVQPGKSAYTGGAATSPPTIDFGAPPPPPR